MLHVTAELGVSQRLACRVLDQHRFTQREAPRRPDDEAAPTQAMIDLATQYGRYGYRRITALLHAEGWACNHRRMERILRAEGLKGARAAAKARTPVDERRLVPSAAARPPQSCLGV